MTLQQAIAYMEGRLASPDVRGEPVAFYRSGQTAAYSPTGTVGMRDTATVTVLDGNGAAVNVQAVSVIVKTSDFAACGAPKRGDVCRIGALRFQVFPVAEGGSASEPVDVYGNSLRVWLKEVAP